MYVRTLLTITTIIPPPSVEVIQPPGWTGPNQGTSRPGRHPGRFETHSPPLAPAGIRLVRPIMPLEALMNNGDGPSQHAWRRRARGPRLVAHPGWEIQGFFILLPSSSPSTPPLSSLLPFLNLQRLSPPGFCLSFTCKSFYDLVIPFYITHLHSLLAVPAQSPFASTNPLPLLPSPSKHQSPRRPPPASIPPLVDISFRTQHPWCPVDSCRAEVYTGSISNCLPES